MSSIAPSPWAFIRSRARSSRYLRSRSKFTRSCQSIPTMPTFAIFVSSSEVLIYSRYYNFLIDRGAGFPRHLAPALGLGRDIRSEILRGLAGSRRHAAGRKSLLHLRHGQDPDQCFVELR